MVRELTPLQLVPENNLKIITQLTELDELDNFFISVEHASLLPVVGFDIETTPRKDYFARKVRLIQFGTHDQQFVIDLLNFAPDADALYACQGYYGSRLDLAPNLKTLITRLMPVLVNKSITKAGVNLGFEYMHMYWNFGIRAQGFFDCSIVERVIQAGYHSLKDYAYYGMEEMVGRYFGWQVDKTLQESFNLTDACTPAQYEYAALDTRLPLSLMRVQNLILEGHTAQTCKELTGFDESLLGDNLVRVAQIENDCIGAFQDMHVHGENLDKQAWRERTRLNEEKLAETVTMRLDPIFLPLVGSKWDLPLPDTYERLRQAANGLKRVSQEELAYNPRIRAAKGDPALESRLRQEKADLEADRDNRRKQMLEDAMTLQKRRTYVKNLADKCQGDALVNYRSRDQVLALINQMPEVQKERKGKPLTDLEDDTLEQYNHIPVIEALRIKTKLGKEIGTYGYSWTYEWVTGPSKEEGWLNPGDGKLHCTYNQYEAETGRSSSSQPNGQNLPKDKALRACFIVDPPDEDEPDGYVMVTADMSGAELRILAELAKDPIWIECFNRDQDVHCICAELMESERWPEMQQPGCKFYALNDDGTYRKQKCKCQGHEAIRNDIKPVNFGIPYGIGVNALAIELKKPKQVVRSLVNKHMETFPIIWYHLNNSAQSARMTRKAFDMFGRRRLFPLPTWDRAIEKFKEDNADKLKYDDEQIARNFTNFEAAYKRKPTPHEKWRLKHREPTTEEIEETQASLRENAARQGKNHEIQGTNASIAKIAMGAGYAPDGTPYLWHTLPKYKAKLVKFVHDELVVQCPKRYGQAVADLIGEAFLKAGAEVMKLVKMKFDYSIATYWVKD